METQIDIFGNQIPLEQVNDPKHETIKTRWRKMYGYDDQHTCGTCRFTCDFEINGKRHLKCNLMGISESTETDISAADTACRRYAKREHEE